MSLLYDMLNMQIFQILIYYDLQINLELDEKQHDF